MCILMMSLFFITLNACSNTTIHIVKQSGIMKSKNERLPSFLSSRLQLDRILLPNHFSVPKQQRWHGNESHSQETQQTVSPAQAQRFVHSWSSKRKQGAEKTTQGCHTSDSRRSELREAIDHVCLQRCEDTHEAETKGDEGDDGYDPVHMIVSCPAISSYVSGSSAREKGRQLT